MGSTNTSSRGSESPAKSSKLGKLSVEGIGGGLTFNLKQVEEENLSSVSSQS